MPTSRLGSAVTSSRSSLLTQHRPVPRRWPTVYGGRLGGCTRDWTHCERSRQASASRSAGTTSRSRISSGAQITRYTRQKGSGGTVLSSPPQRAAVVVRTYAVRPISHSSRVRAPPRSLRLLALCCAAMTSGYLWRAALEPNGTSPVATERAFRPAVSAPTVTIVPRNIHTHATPTRHSHT